MKSVLIIKSLLFYVLYLFKVIVRSYRDIVLPHSRNLYSVRTGTDSYPSRCIE